MRQQLNKGLARNLHKCGLLACFSKDVHPICSTIYIDVEYEENGWINNEDAFSSLMCHFSVMNDSVFHLLWRDVGTQFQHEVLILTLAGKPDWSIGCHIFRVPQKIFNVQILVISLPLLLLPKMQVYTQL